MPKFIVFPGNNPEVIREALIKRGNWEEIPESVHDPLSQASFVWKPCNYGQLGYFKLDEAQKKRKDFVQIFNHFPDNSGMCTKTGIIKTLKQYYMCHEEARAAKYCIWDTTPTSFLLAAGFQDLEFNIFMARVKELSKKNFQRESVPAKHCMENMWLVKPANLNQGKGIEVFRTLKSMLIFLGLKPSNSQWVAQKYIEKPLLYNKRKFDIRVWVLITNKNEVFFYKHGYMRTSSSSYDTRNQNNYVHLTNNCLQKHGDNYGVFEEGNTLSFKVLQDYLRQQYPDYKVDLEAHIISRFKDFIIDSFLAWKNNLNPTKRKNVFELFGYDFLIDEDLRVWLIEINTNPYLGVPNPFIADLLPKMVDDMLEITLDPIFPPKKRVKKDGRANYFQLIYSENPSIYSSTPVNCRSSFSKSPYPIPELDPTTHILKYTLLEETKAETQIDIPAPQIDTPVPQKLPQRVQSASVEPRKTLLSSKSPSLTLEGILKNFQSPGYFGSMFDTQSLDNQITFIISSLISWRQLSTQDVELGCSALVSIPNTPAIVILAEQKNILSMSKLLSNQDIPTEIKLATIEVINNLIKDQHD